MAGKKHFAVYQDTAGEWRWALIAANGRKVADSGEGYVNRDDCVHGIELVRSVNADTPVRDVEAPDVPPEIPGPGLTLVRTGRSFAETTAAPAMHSQVTCERCGLTYLHSGAGLCPNNNCPRHYASYAGWLAAGNPPIPEQENPDSPHAPDATGTP